VLISFAFSYIGSFNIVFMVWWLDPRFRFLRSVKSKMEEGAPRDPLEDLKDFDRQKIDDVRKKQL
jgi:hypothetical protein